MRCGPGDVAVENDDVGEVSGFEAAFEVLAELGEGGGLGIGVDSLIDGELLLRLEGLGSLDVLPGDGGIEAAEGRDGLDGVIGSEGDDDAVIKERLPGVGAPGAIGAKPCGGPGHIGEEVGRLHAGDDAELSKAVEGTGRDDLSVLDAEAEVGWPGGDG